ncbi:MAG TPA: glycosyltransferase family 4 protein [Candidatus Babeliales bacterium]|nr:glycosyltransferase family 4 protein [Candidatus Babeliales bacterium]
MGVKILPAKNINRIRVLHITSSLKVGGAETVLISLLRALQNSKSDSPELIFENTVLYFHAGPKLLELAELGITAQQVRGKFHQYDPWFLVRLYCLIKLNRPDIIHSSLWFANFMARLFGKILNIPVIATIHSPVSSNTPNSLQGFRTLVDRLTAHWPQVTVAVSTSTAQQVQQALPKLKNLVVIVNGIDELWFDTPVISKKICRALPTSPRLRRAGTTNVSDTIPANSFVIGTVGRLVPSKNYSNLITSFARLYAKYPQLILIIIGSGELELSLKAQVQNLDLSHKIFFVHTTQALDYYQYFDCFVQPSYYEGLSMALLEAGLFKLPVVASANLNLHDVITNNYNGLLIDPYKLVELELALEKLILDLKLRKTLGANLLKTVKQDFSLAKMVGAYKKLYLECVRVCSKPPTP